MIFGKNLSFLRNTEDSFRYHLNNYTPVICVCNNDASRDLNRGIVYNYGFHRRMSEGLMLVHYTPCVT